ncbi:hemolysin family protein [Solicola sp. PLA-1-18]|uniref:hemolysin family protein n=1 Tax=Solicola sp. PLA-1-18 TaxID=3380532 RepID=UPI003B7D6FD9
MEWILLASSLLLMVACGIFVAAEFSFVTVDRASVERAAEGGDAGAGGVLAGLRTLSTQLSGAQLGITLTNLAIGYLSEPAIAELLRPVLRDVGVTGAAVSAIAITVALVVSTVVTMLVGELVPKNLAISLPLATAKATQLPMRAFTRSMAWPIRHLNGAANAILRRLGVEPQEELRSARSPEELRSLVIRSADEGVLESPTAQLVARSIAFGERTAADVRTPRVRVRFLDATDTAQDVIEAARETGHSRFPVIGRSEDDVVGIVHIKQAVAVAPDRRRSVRLVDVAAPASVVPDSIELDPLLGVLREQGMQMAVVVDEYGGTDGVVTIEDLVEEIVGDIADEHDRGSSGPRHRPDGTWSLSGMLRPDEVAEATGLRLPEADDYETVAGLVLTELGRLAVKGDAVSVDVEVPDPADDEAPARVVHVELRVERMDGRRIDRVALVASLDGEPWEPAEVES